MKNIAVLVLDSSQKTPAAEHVQHHLQSLGVGHQLFDASTVGHLRADRFDALVVLDDVNEAAPLMEAFHASSKPIGAFDQAIAVLAETLGAHEITVAIAPGSGLSGLSQTGAYPEICKKEDFITDRENKIVTTLDHIEGIRLALLELIEMS
jgi:hypothetical protein